MREVVASLPSASSDSTATGTKLYRANCEWDLIIFGLSASFVAAPVTSTELFKWLVTNVSGLVKIQTMHRPLAQGSTVKPSGRLPSSLDDEFGSSTDGTLADARACLKCVTGLIPTHHGTSASFVLGHAPIPLMGSSIPVIMVRCIPHSR